MGSCAGIDWAAEKHDVLVANETGEERLAATFARVDPKARPALTVAPPLAPKHKS
jgi:predicted dinucleotide-binding enzyme